MPRRFSRLGMTREKLEQNAKSWSLICPTLFRHALFLRQE